MNVIENPISIEMSQRKMATVLIFSVLFFIIAILLWIQKDIDYNIVIWNNYIYENKSYLKSFQFISRFGMGIISILYSILIFLSFKNRELELYFYLLCFPLLLVVLQVIC